MLIEYKCINCGCIVGRLDSYNIGVSFAKFIVKSIPIGQGSGLYDKWICINCDEDRVRADINLNSLAKRPWHI